MVPSTSDDWLC